MLQINIPGAGMLEIQSLVLDFNGTIATDGKLINGVKDRLMRICENLQLFVITADTNGTVQKRMFRFTGNRTYYRTASASGGKGSIY